MENLPEPTDIKNGGVKPLLAEPGEGSKERAEPERVEEKLNNNGEQKRNSVAEQSLQFPSNYSDDLQNQPSRYDLLSNIDMYTIASHTQDFIPTPVVCLICIATKTYF